VGGVGGSEGRWGCCLSLEDVMGSGPDRDGAWAGRGLGGRRARNKANHRGEKMNKAPNRAVELVR